MATDTQHTALIKHAADSISRLRSCDLFRLLDGFPKDNRFGITCAAHAAWIKTMRPDLAQEVDEVMAELE